MAFTSTGIINVVYHFHLYRLRQYGHVEGEASILIPCWLFGEKDHSSWEKAAGSCGSGSVQTGPKPKVSGCGSTERSCAGVHPSIAWSPSPSMAVTTAGSLTPGLVMEGRGNTALVAHMAHAVAPPAGDSLGRWLLHSALNCGH